jgi:hypothetical protein
MITKLLACMIISATAIFAADDPRPAVLARTLMGLPSVSSMRLEPRTVRSKFLQTLADFAASSDNETLRKCLQTHAKLIGPLPAYERFDEIVKAILVTKLRFHKTVPEVKLSEHRFPIPGGTFFQNDDVSSGRDHNDLFPAIRINKGEPSRFDFESFLAAYTGAPPPADAGVKYFEFRQNQQCAIR